MNRAVAYIRVSSTDQLNGHSMENQEEKVRMYASLYNMEMVEVIVDRGLSGRKTDNRPGYQRMMDMVRSKQVDKVIVYALSRLSRNTGEFLNALKIMDANGVEFCSVTEGISSAGATGKMLITVMAAMAQFESDQLSERITSVKKFCKSAGRTYTNPTFGYDNVFDLTQDGKRRNGRMVPNEQEQEIIKKIFAMHAEDYSLRKICNILNHQAAFTKNGKPWQANGIKQVLENSFNQILKVA